MDKKEYITRQLYRTRNKRFEYYVITRIIHLLDDLSIKFVTQQHVVRKGQIALTDLFFPQFGFHVEIDEGPHFTENKIALDKVRDADIISATNHEIEHVNVTKSIEEINQKIDRVIEKIRAFKKNDLEFKPWDIEAEFNPQTYIKLGYMDVSDNVAFRKVMDVCNCFGHNYKGYQRAGAKHPNKEIMLWCPILFREEDKNDSNKWRNVISEDEDVIMERNKDDEKAEEHVFKHLNNKEKNKHQRIVFARAKDNLGQKLLRFKGHYKLDIEKSNINDGLCWRRISKRVDTYPQKVS